MRIKAYNTRFSDDVVVFVVVFLVVVVQRVSTICSSTFWMRKRKHSSSVLQQLASLADSGKTMQENSIGLHVLWYSHSASYFFFFFHQVIGGAYESTLRRAASVTLTPLSSLRTIVRVNQSTFNVICLHSIALCFPLTRVQHIVCTIASTCTQNHVVIWDCSHCCWWNSLVFDKKKRKKKQGNYIFSLHMTSYQFYFNRNALSLLFFNWMNSMRLTEIRSIRQQQCNDKNNGIIYFIGLNARRQQSMVV